jgi:hypothetical protein
MEWCHSVRTEVLDRACCQQISARCWRTCKKHRVSNDAFDVVIGGETTGTDRHRDVATVVPYISAGATWWLEDISPWAFGWKWTDRVQGVVATPAKEMR